MTLIPQAHAPRTNSTVTDLEECVYVCVCVCDKHSIRAPQDSRRKMNQDLCPRASAPIPDAITNLTPTSFLPATHSAPTTTPS